MELIEVINKISTMYRAELKKKGDIALALAKINEEFTIAQENDWETMTHARYLELDRERDRLEQDKRYHAMRAVAMSDVREMFLELLDGEMTAKEE